MAIPKEPLTARLRRRRRQLLARLQMPPDGLPGSLALTHRRCGKPSCHCAEGEGHPVWSLTFMARGKKHVERIPNDWVDSVRPRVRRGRKFKDAVAEFLAVNAQLLALERSHSLGTTKGDKDRKHRPK